MFLASPGLAATEQVNSIPGAQAGFMVRIDGVRTFHLVIKRLDPGAISCALADVRLVRPATPEA